MLLGKMVAVLDFYGWEGVLCTLHIVCVCVCVWVGGWCVCGVCVGGVCVWVGGVYVCVCVCVCGPKGYSSVVVVEFVDTCNA